MGEAFAKQAVLSTLYQINESQVKSLKRSDSLKEKNRSETLESVDELFGSK